jgi:eukaryotic-like serine/threonine-protein kinase
MNGTNPEPPDTIERDAWVDALCDRFEVELRAGRALAVTEFLSGAGIDPTTAHPDLLSQLGRVEAAYRDPVPATGGDEAHTPLAVPIEARADSEFGVGTVLAGKYRLVEEIGGGGMGEVWRARQTEPVKREVAVKVIKSGMDSAAVLARFEAERQALALMKHEYIAKVYDAGSTAAGAGGRPFFVMELVEGVPVTEFCDRHRLTLDERLLLFVRVCEAIQHAHQKGVIHRDIKPSNVLAARGDAGPVPKVIDFGVAKATGERLTDRTLATGFGALVGTPEYMSPEQAAGTGDIDTRSDVYSLGVLLYELLTGSTPLDRKALSRAALGETIRLVCEEPTPRPSQRASGAAARVAEARGTEPAKLTRALRGDLDWVLLMALEKNRERRYESASALAADVERHLAHEPVRARPPSRGYRLGKFVRRNRGPVLAAALVLVALVAGTVGTAVGLVAAHRQQRETETARATADAARKWAEASEAEARRERLKALAVAAASTLDRGQHVCESGDVIRGLHVLAAALEPAVASGDVALEEAVRYGLGAWLPRAPAFRGHVPGDHTGACLSPDGAILVTGSADGAVRCWDANTLRPTCPEGRTGAHVLKLAWQPRGDAIAVLCRDGTLRLWRYGSDFRTARVVRASGPMNAVPHGGLSFTPDGKQLLVGAMGRAALLFDVAKGEPVGPGLAHGASHTDAVAISADGTRAVVATPQWTARVYDLATAQPVSPVVRTLGSNFCAGFSPDGTAFFTGHHLDGSVRVWDAKTGAPLGPRIAPGGPVLAAAFSPDGRHLLVGGWMSHAREWDWRTGQPVGPPIAGEARAATYTPDGTGIVIANSSGTGLWRLPDRDLLWSRPLPASVTGLCFRPDSDELALAMSAAITPNSDPAETRYLRRYRTRDGSEVLPRLLQRNDRWVNGVVYSPDAAVLYGTEGRTITAWNLATGQEQRRFLPKVPGAGSAAFHRIALSADGRYVAATGWDDGSPTTAWDTATGEVVLHLPRAPGDGSLIGFLPGTARLYLHRAAKLTAWNLSTPAPQPAHDLLVLGSTYTSAEMRPDGNAVAVCRQQTFKEFALDTGKETGFAGNGIVAGALLYAPNGRLLFARDATGHAAWHPTARKKVGPAIASGAGAVYAISPDGTCVAAVSDDRQLQVWRVPQPLAGAPADVARAVHARTGFRAENVDALALVSSAEWPARAVPAPQLPVTDFRELHGADTDALKMWFAALPKTHRLTNLNVQEGGTGPRFDALAIDDGTAALRYEAHWVVTAKAGPKAIDDDGATMFAKGWSRALCVPYMDGNVYSRHHIYSSSLVYWEYWNVQTQLDAKLAEARGHRRRPISLMQYDNRLSLNTGPDDGLPWELHRDLSAAQVKQKLDECRKRKWRPDLIHRHRTDADKFVLVLVDNPHDTPWEYDAALNTSTYEQKLVACRGRGFRPHYVHSWVANGSAVYSVLWLGDYKPLPVKPELAPPPRTK